MIELVWLALLPPAGLAAAIHLHRHRKDPAMPITHTATYEAVIPTQPAVYAVVIDRNGLAWQHLAGVWVRNAAVIMFMSRVEGALKWADLLVGHGPVTLVHEGKPEVVASEKGSA